MTVKEQAIDLIASLPDGCTWDDIRYRLYVRHKIEQGLADIENDRVIPHEEVKRQIREWQESFGQLKP